MFFLLVRVLCVFLEILKVMAVMAVLEAEFLVTTSEMLLFFLARRGLVALLSLEVLKLPALLSEIGLVLLTQLLVFVEVLGLLFLPAMLLTIVKPLTFVMGSRGAAHVCGAAHARVLREDFRDAADLPDRVAVCGPPAADGSPGDRAALRESARLLDEAARLHDGAGDALPPGVLMTIVAPLALVELLGLVELPSLVELLTLAFFVEKFEVLLMFLVLRRLVVFLLIAALEMTALLCVTGLVFLMLPLVFVKVGAALHSRGAAEDREAVDIRGAVEVLELPTFMEQLAFEETRAYVKKLLRFVLALVRMELCVLALRKVLITDLSLFTVVVLFLLVGALGVLML
ncbi:unnamed protein product [Prorocentrum cordatum]|uniref:Uncharacterized protein n=1 Tax=Prorocentrum cordatum TaxID=2364126 RepID=A0ABN9Q2L3_9DINO|nr:unnamed protein product [Polarella glacialis]